MLKWGKMVENDKVFSKITCIFGAVKVNPAQRTVGDYSPFKEFPGRPPP